MELSITEISNFLFEYWYIVIALLLARFIWIKITRTSRFIGRRGEKKVITSLLELNSAQYYVINDITLRNRNGTTQLDHVVISDYGIFVIETKNYTGWIFGKEHTTYWTQVIFRFKSKFYNPVLQVKGHARALRDLLAEFPDVDITPIVAFTENATLHTETETAVVYTRQLLQHILKYENRSICERDKKQIFNLLKSAALTGRKTKKRHIKHARQQRQKFKKKIKKNICPRCDAPFEYKEGRYGRFRGCSRFPRCKFTI